MERAGRNGKKPAETQRVTAIGSRSSLMGALLLASCLAVPPACFPTATPAERQRAIEAFDQAQRLRTTLESQSQYLCTKKDYKNVIDAYYSVYLLNPAYSKSPVALATVAELYEKMGRLFAVDSYYLGSIRTYRFLAQQYPQNPLARDARFAVEKSMDRSKIRTMPASFSGLHPDVPPSLTGWTKHRNQLTLIDRN